MASFVTLIFALLTTDLALCTQWGTPETTSEFVISTVKGTESPFTVEPLPTCSQGILAGLLTPSLTLLLFTLVVAYKLRSVLRLMIPDRIGTLLADNSSYAMEIRYVYRNGDDEHTVSVRLAGGATPTDERTENTGEALVSSSLVNDQIGIAVNSSLMDEPNSSRYNNDVIIDMAE